MRIKNFPFLKYCEDNNIKNDLHYDHRKQYYHGYTIYDKNDNRILVVHEMFKEFVGQTATDFDYFLYDPLIDKIIFGYPKNRETKLQEIIDYYLYQIKFGKFI